MLVVGLLLGGISWLMAGWLGLTFDNASAWRELSVYGKNQHWQALDAEMMLTSVAR